MEKRILVIGSGFAGLWAALAAARGVEINSGRVVVDSMASLVEQSAYCWYAQEELNARVMPLDTAAHTVAMVWYRAIFG